jgi:hypothetical protein
MKNNKKILVNYRKLATLLVLSKKGYASVNDLASLRDINARLQKSLNEYQDMKGRDRSTRLQKILNEVGKKQFLSVYKTLKKLGGRNVPENLTEYLLAFKSYNSHQYNLDSLKQRIQSKRQERKSVIDPLSLKLADRPRFQKYFQRFDKSRSHRPMQNDSKKYYGVEIECLFPDSDAVEEFRLAAEKIAYIGIGSDGSIRTEGGQVGVELRILTDDSLSNLKKTCQLLSDFGVTVNTSTGLHIHFDHRHNIDQLTTKTIHSRLNSALLKQLAALVPKSRRENTYCQLRVSGKNRYSAVNLVALQKYGTIEIRLHSGTIDFYKIKQWIKLWDYLLYSKRLRKYDVNSPTGLIDSLKDEELKAYFHRRFSKFNPDQTITSPVSAQIELNEDEVA